MGEITGFPAHPQVDRGIIQPLNSVDAISVDPRPLQESDDLFGSLSQNELQDRSAYFYVKD